MSALDRYIDGFTEFLRAAPSSYHAAAEVARALEERGFTRLDETEEWPSAPGRYVLTRDGAAMAWVVPEGADALTPFRIIGAHTDSPAFTLKPHPSTATRGWLQAAVEIYGGPLLNSWLDRELELAGRIVTRDAQEHLVRTGPLLRIPQLAIHLDRAVSTEGVLLDKQRQTQPVWGVGDGSGEDILEHLAGIAGIDASTIAGYDMLTADTAAPARFGLDDALFAAGRMDNLTSVYAGLVALAGAPADAQHISVLAAFDHEELGSQSRSGASGPVLEDLLGRISAGIGASLTERLRAFASSWCISSDAGHAVHPNYPERHDPVNQPVPGGGPLLKLNANQRYATDAAGSALWARVCGAADVPFQEFVSNNTVPCGSTIGPLTATRLGIRTVDVGAPLLSMHSARELADVDDLHALSLALSAFLAGA